jgi:hypothetical protein
LFYRLNPSSTPELYEYRDYIDVTKVNSGISITSSDSKNHKSKKKHSKRAGLTNDQQFKIDSNDLQENLLNSTTSDKQTVTREKRQKQVKQRQTTSDLLTLENNLLETINVISIQNANNTKVGTAYLHEICFFFS